MASDRIEELKTIQFPTERRGGYDRRAVDAYLAELADWLETGGEDDARRAVIQRAMSDVGERTGSILSSAQESADRLTSEAQAEAERLRSTTEQTAAKVRSDAEQAAAKVRSEADAYSTETRAAADEQASKAAEAAAAEAKALTEEAEARLAEADAAAAARTRGIEQEIAGLVRKRRDVVANLEQLDAEMRLAIEGPGERDLGLSERVEAAVDSPEAVAAEEAEPVEVEREDDATEAIGGPGEAPTTVSEVVEQPSAALDPDTDERPEPDTEERERRRRSVDSVDPPTEDTKLTELL
ncbi:MAG TPA: DivIVA domain-containing protein [Solirubrobacterales bacterium]|jgi:DivIVA domain-containing protein|nr:DivIVA domain-containing protein [Solirubrobacterales bacterium]